MKRFSEHIKESAIFSNPGNLLMTTGVTNHYTPIENILTNVKNLFCLQLGIVATVGEDNVSIKLASSYFTSPEKVNELLWRPLYNDVFTYGTSSIQGYITSQGLSKVSTVNLGAYYVVYFSPEDIRTAEDPCDMAAKSQCDCPCPGELAACEGVIDEVEVNRIYEADDLLGGDDDSEKKDDLGRDEDSDDNDDDKKEDTDDKKEDKKSSTTLKEILANEDRVKAAKQLEILVSQKLSLPRDYYFAFVKFKNGDEAIALRWKYEKKLPTGNSTEKIRSLIHIFISDDYKVWVQDYAKDSIVELPKEVKTLIENILKILEAEKTNDPDVFTLKGIKDKSDDEKDSDENNDEDNNEGDENSEESNDKDSDEDNDKGGDLL